MPVKTDTASGTDELDAIWRALSNSVRRTILDLLMEGPMTTGALADRFPDLSRFAVMQHLKVLESGNLIIARRDGRKRYNYLNPIPIQQIYDRWVHRHMRHWADALLGLKTELEERDAST